MMSDGDKDFRGTNTLFESPREFSSCSPSFFNNHCPREERERETRERKCVRGATFVSTGVRFTPCKERIIFDVYF